MNPNARGPALQFAYRRCCEDLQDARLKRSFVKQHLPLAIRANSVEQIATISGWLPKSRREINRLTARKTRLRRKLESLSTQSQSTSNHGAN